MTLLTEPLSEIEKAELNAACAAALTSAGLLLLRRALFQLDSLAAGSRVPQAEKGHEKDLTRAGDDGQRHDPLTAAVNELIREWRAEADELDGATNGMWIEPSVKRNCADELEAATQRHARSRASSGPERGDLGAASTRVPPPQNSLEQLREMIEAFKVGTVVQGRSKSERFEVETIQKTLNVVLAEIDRLRDHASPQDFAEIQQRASR